MVMKTVKKEPTFNSIPNPNPTFLDRERVLRRRLLRLRRLSAIYKRHYWSLIEELRIKHRDYYWEFGKKPYEIEGGEVQKLGFEERKKCAFNGCKTKSMALTNYCHSHILFDRKQTLYKPCGFLIKSGAQEQICRKPILRASNPSLCNVHYKKSQKGISKALKKLGFNNNNNNNNPSSSKNVPKLSVLISESIREIQRKRKLVNSSQNEDKSNKE